MKKNYQMKVKVNKVLVKYLWMIRGVSLYLEKFETEKLAVDEAILGENKLKSHLCMPFCKFWTSKEMSYPPSPASYYLKE